MTLKLISPKGATSICEQIIVLIYGGRKYWLNANEYKQLGAPKWDEVPLEEFHQYPDGHESINVNGVMISAKQTHLYCPKNVSEPTTTPILSVVLESWLNFICFAIFSNPPIFLLIISNHF